MLNPFIENVVKKGVYQVGMNQYRAVKKTIYDRYGSMVTFFCIERMSRYPEVVGYVMDNDFFNPPEFHRVVGRY